MYKNEMLTQTLHKFSLLPTSPLLLAWTIGLLSALCPSSHSTCCFSLVKPMIASSQFENHHLQIWEVGVGAEQEKSRLRKGNAVGMRKAGMAEQGGWSLERPVDTCIPEDKRSGTCNSFHSCCDRREPKPSTASCTLLLEAVAFTRMKYAHAGSSIRTLDKARMSLYTTSSFNYRKFQTDLFQLTLSEGEDDWLKQFKKSTNPCLLQQTTSISLL